jgi:hypothetical protein
MTLIRSRWPAALILLALAAAVVVSRADTPRASAANGSWTGRYWNNTTLSGGQVLQRNDGTSLDFLFTGSPGPGVNANNWSARWTRTDTYAAATYRFTATSDDGMRVFVDGGATPVIDAWFDQAPTTYIADVPLSAGSHTVTVEFYDATNNATAKLTIVDAATLPPGWMGDYYTNVNLQGTPAVSRNDGDALNFDWGLGAPAPGIPASQWTTSASAGRAP